MRSSTTSRRHEPESFIPRQKVVTQSRTKGDSSSINKSESNRSLYGYDGDVEGGNDGKCNEDSISGTVVTVLDDVTRGNISNAQMDHSSDGEQVPGNLVSGQMIALELDGVINLVSDSDDDEMDIEDGVLTEDD